MNDHARESTKVAIQKGSSLVSRLASLRTQLHENQPLLNQVKLHESNLATCKTYLENTDHGIAFIGSVGVGKTTAICHLLGLVDPEIGPLLSTSSGRTTLCEVEIVRASRPRIRIEPLRESEVEDYLVDFVGTIEQRSGRGTDLEGDQSALSSEFERCLRNMLGLPVKREKGPANTMSRRDLAKERLEALGSVEAFLDESLTNLRLAERTLVELEPATDEPPAKWLRETFESVNHGRHPETPMPRRIVIEWPGLSVGGDFLNVRVIDTKGLDSNVEREDIDNQLKSDRTICVACSRFNDAPEQSVQALFGHMREIGLSAQLAYETALLVLPRMEEAARVMAEDGIVADGEEGKAIRQEQIEDTLRHKLHASATELPPICYFDSGADSPGQVLDVIESTLGNLRQQRIDQINEIEQAVQELETNREAAHGRAAFETVSNAIAAWAETSRRVLANVQHLYKPLVDDIGTKEVYASSIRAAVNRRGDWPNFDFHYKLALAARRKVVTSFQHSVAEISSVLENQERQDGLSPAHPFIRQVLRTVKTRVERINDRAGELARATFEPPLKDDGGFWTKQQGEWGKGSGYKNRVAEGTEQWFRQSNPAPKEQMIQREITNGWVALVAEIEALLAKR